MSILMNDPLQLNAKDARQALESSRELAHYLGERKDLQFHIQTGKGKGTNLPLSPMVLRVIHDVLVQLAKGEAISLVPHDSEMTTQEAANLLNVSRPFLAKLLDDQIIPSRKVGTHRRVLFKDVLQYKSASFQKSQQALDELARETQSLNLGY